MLTNPLAMLSFVTPWMALGAVAAFGLPLLAHLLSRTRYREVAFPAARLVEKAVAATSRIEHPRHRLLMILRWLILLLLVFAFMRPQWMPEADARNSSDGVKLVVLIDASASMQRTYDGATLYERAVREAGTLIDGLDPSRDAAAVIRVDDRGQALLPEATAQLSVLTERLGTTDAGYTHANWSSALATAQRLIDNAQRPGMIVTLSDQQGEAPEIEVGDNIYLTEPMRHLPIEGPTENTAVRLIDLRPFPPIAGQPLTATVEIRHFGDQPRTVKVTASLGETSSPRALTLSPGASQQIEFQLPAPTVRRATLRLRLDGQDVLSADDATGLPLLIQPQSHVLIVHRDSSTALTLAKRISALVNPGEVEGTTLPKVDLLPTSQAAAFLNSAEMADLRTVIVLDAIESEGALSQSLEAYAQRGGGAIQFVADPDANRTTTTAADVDFSHPALRVFEGPARGGLTALPWPGVDSAPINEQAEALLADAQGRTIVASLDRGRGRVIAINAALPTGPGGLLAEPAFVVLFNELCRYASPGPAPPDPIRPGDPLPTAFTAADQQRWPNDADQQADAFTAPGLYTAIAPNGNISEQYWVEIAPEESDTRASAPWPSVDSGNTNLPNAAPSNSAELASTIRPNPIELWPYLTMGILLLAAGESLLLARFAGACQPAVQGGAA